jgi:hypothetical protein
MPPIIALSEEITIIIVDNDGFMIKDIRSKGASFCHVDRIRHASQEIEDITGGNQK